LVWQLLNNAHDLKSAFVFLKTCQVFTAASIIISNLHGQVGQVILEGDRPIVRLPRSRDFYYFNRYETLPLRPRSLLRPLQAQYHQQKRTALAFLAANQDLTTQEFWPELLNPSCPGIWRPTTVALAALHEQQLEIAYLTSATPGHYQINWPTLPAVPSASTSLCTASTVAGIDLTESPRAFALAVQTATQAFQNRDYAKAATALADAQTLAPEKTWQKYLAVYAALNSYFLLPEHPHDAWWKLQAQLKAFRPTLPPPWPDHLTLFIARINKILGTPPPRLKVESPLIKRLLASERHLPPAVFLATTRFLTQLRPDILEIVYPHAT
jgi:hypothetical protein